MTAHERPVGWYIHHHGGGHLSRFLAVRAALEADVVCFSSLPEPSELPARTRWIRLERDDEPETDDGGITRDPRDCSPAAHGALHWAPLGHRGHAGRLRRIGDAVVDHDIRTVVVDVSVEVALFVRLMGVAPVVFAQPGTRTDDPHTLAYRVAERIIAPWPQRLIDAPQLTAVRNRVVYTGGISRHEGRTAQSGQHRTGVLVLGGRGGTSSTMSSVAAAQSATPGTEWTTLGIPSSSTGDDGAWVDDPWPLLTAADVVVSWAGQNSVADLAAAGAHAIVIPQERPFDEQRTTARALATAGLAVVAESWPDASAWPDLLDRARVIEPCWQRWNTDGAASRAARAIDEVSRATGR